jgi:hypothetical protein
MKRRTTRHRRACTVILIGCCCLAQASCALPWSRREPSRPSKFQNALDRLFPADPGDVFFSDESREIDDRLQRNRRDVSL